MTARIAYIIPTIGRDTLAAAVDGIRAQMLPGDQLFVVGDGPRDSARETMRERHHPNLFYLEIPFKGDWGSSPIDYVMPLVSADYIAYLGDDDLIMEHAMDGMRTALIGDPCPHLFALATGGATRCRNVKHGEVSGQQIVVPNDPTRLPRYAVDHGTEEANDSCFIRRVVAAWNGRIEMHDLIIAHNSGQRRGRP